MRFAADDRVTVTDPHHWHYGQAGIVTDPDYDGFGQKVYVVTFPHERRCTFTGDQLDFTEEAPRQ